MVSLLCVCNPVNTHVETALKQTLNKFLTIFYYFMNAQWNFDTSLPFLSYEILFTFYSGN